MPADHPFDHSRVDQPIETTPFTVAETRRMDDCKVAGLAAGDGEAADQHTARATQQLVEAGEIAAEYPLQAVWWWRYQVLRQGPSKAKRIRDQAWTYLNRAYETMLHGVTTLSDEGLRRNHLNKVAINRHILLEWIRQAAERGIRKYHMEKRPRSWNS